jgi:hypothetical protein
MRWTIAAIGILMAGGAVPASAHEPDAGKAHKEKIVIISERHGDGGEAHADTDGPVSRTMIADCGGDKTEVSGDDAGKGQKTKIVICSRGDASPADRAKRLEHALERINSNDALSAEAKAKITTALRDAIGRLNAPAK